MLVGVLAPKAPSLKREVGEAKWPFQHCPAAVSGSENQRSAQTLLDTYMPDPEARAMAFKAVESIPSIARKAKFAMKWMDSINDLQQLDTKAQRRQFLLNLICFASCIEGLFFFAAFAYVWFLRSRGLLPGLAAGTNWVFRDESAHMTFAFEVIRVVRTQEPDLFDAELSEQVVRMIDDAVECETQFAADVLIGGVAGMSLKDMRSYLEYTADQRLVMLGLPKRFHARNPFDFIALQDVPELTNFFERRVSAYHLGIEGDVAFDHAF